MGRCKNLGDIGPCEMLRPNITMKQAGDMVCLDLTKPIDVSQMNIGSLSAKPIEGEFSRISVERKAILYCYVINDGQQERLTIEFTLESQRYPKI